MSDLVLAHRQELVDIADAIRAANGTTSGIKIDEIPQLIEDLGLNYTTGTFTASATGTSETITHGLGVTPTIIIFCKQGTLSTPTTTSSCSASYNDTAISLKIGSYYYHCGNDPAYVSAYSRSYCSTTSSYKYVSKYYYYKNLQQGYSTSATTSYSIKATNSTTFKTPTYIRAGGTYVWYAIGGLEL